MTQQADLVHNLAEAIAAARSSFHRLAVALAEVDSAACELAAGARHAPVSANGRTVKTLKQCRRKLAAALAEWQQKDAALEAAVRELVPGDEEEAT